MARKLADNERQSSRDGFDSIKDFGGNLIAVVSLIILIILVGKYGCNDTKLSTAQSAIKLQTTSGLKDIDKVYLHLGKRFDYIDASVRKEVKKKLEDELFRDEYNEVIKSYFGPQDNPGNLEGFNWKYDGIIEFTHKGESIVLKSVTLHTKKNQYGHVGYDTSRQISEFVFSFDDAPGEVLVRLDPNSLIGRSFFPNPEFVVWMMKESRSIVIYDMFSHIHSNMLT